MLMQKLREKTKLILWIVTISFIGWILFDLGMDIVGKRIAKPYEQGFIAEVDGKRIPYDFYRNILYEMIQDSLKKKGELLEAEEKNIEKNAWFRMIEEIRFRKIAEERNLFLDDSTVLFLLMNYPPPQIYRDTSFRKGDTFDIKKYREFILNPQNFSFAVQYENLIRETFPKEIMRFDLLTLIHLTHDEMINNLTKNHIKYVFEYILFNPYRFELKDEIKDEEILNYYKNHQEEFKEPDLVNLQMVIFWKRPSKQDTISKIEEAKTIRELIINGTPFEDAAKSYASSDTLRKTGGFLGEFEINYFPERIKLVFDTLKNVSEPIIWQGKLYIFKIEKREKNKISLKGIDFIIKTSETTRGEARRGASDFLRLLKKIPFEKVAESLKVEIKETGLFPVESPFIPFIGENKEIHEFIKKGNVNGVSNLIWSPDYFVICKIKEKKEGKIRNFEEVKEIIKRKIEIEKKKEIVMKEAKRIRDEWEKEGKVPDLNENYAIFNKFEYFYITGIFPGLPEKGKIAGILENLKEGEISQPVIFKNNYILIIKLIKKEIPSQKEIEENLQKYAQNFSLNRFNKIWNSWIKELQEEENIKDYRSYLLY
jgi:parvulin-like peptidyl-prolyl isomerase